MFYGLACLFPYLVGIYLILEIKTDMNYTVINILGLTLVLLLLGGLLIEAFAKRLRYLTGRIALTVNGEVGEKLEVEEKDLEEVYMLARDFNTIFENLERYKKHAMKTTAQMLAYVNDLDAYENRLREESLIRANLSRYVGEDVVEEMIRTKKPVFNNVECTATILFADIRGFTTVSEHMEPEEVITMLNRHFAIMVPVIFKYGGTLDKFIGDELMAVFRDHPYGERAPLRAIRAGIEMIKAVEKSGGQQESTAPRLKIGIGINTGRVVIGNVGSENRKDFTAIGDTVNVAARLVELVSGQELVVGEQTYLTCKDQVPMKEAGEIALKNRKMPVRAYKVTMHVPERDKYEEPISANSGA